MIGWIRKKDSRRNSRIRQMVVCPCAEDAARAIIFEEHGAKGVMIEDADNLYLQPETMDEINELRGWLDSCEARLTMTEAVKAKRK